MQIEDSEFEIFAVPVAVGVELQDSDLAVDCLQRSRADTVFMPVQDKWLLYQCLKALIQHRTAPISCPDTRQARERS